MNAENQELLQEAYSVYNNTFKPLLAEVEITYQAQPIPIFNEIRSFNDHIARCYREGVNEEYINEQLNKAQGHIKRATLDCFKFLVVFHNDWLEEFEDKYKRVDLTIIANGTFYLVYREKVRKARTNLREAKNLETIDQERSFTLYQKAYNAYVAVEEIVADNLTSINWARARFTINKTLRVFGWIILAIISGIVSHVLGLVQWESVVTLLGLLCGTG